MIFSKKGKERRVAERLQKQMREDEVKLLRHKNKVNKIESAGARKSNRWNKVQEVVNDVADETGDLIDVVPGGNLLKVVAKILPKVIKLRKKEEKVILNNTTPIDETNRDVVMQGLAKWINAESALNLIRKEEQNDLLMEIEMEIDNPNESVRLDRADARDHFDEGATTMHYIVAGAIILFMGWFSFKLFTKALIPENKDVILILIGNVMGAFLAIVAYLWGSSSGSKLKTKLFGKK